VHTSDGIAQGDPDQRIASRLVIEVRAGVRRKTTHTAVCNAQSRLDMRLARWLLMAHDRIGDDTIPLTHEFLSIMLGVRRPGVTEALHALRKQGLISYGRGQIAVENRKGMERTAGEAYGTPEAEYRRLIG
jgi:CRP-like cAMP-binding protein